MFSGKLITVVNLPHFSSTFFAEPSLVVLISYSLKSYLLLMSAGQAKASSISTSPTPEDMTNSMKIEIPKLDCGSKYNSWRFKMMAVLASLGIADKVTRTLAEETVTWDDAEKKQAVRVYASAVTALGGEPLVLVETNNDTTISGLLKTLDGKYRSTGAVAKQQALKSLVSDLYDPSKESMEVFVGRKYELVFSRLGDISKEDLFLLGMTTCLPRAYDSVTSDIRADANITVEVAKRRLFEYEMARRSSREELVGDKIKPVALHAETTDEAASSSKTKKNSAEKDAPNVMKMLKKLEKKVTACYASSKHNNNKGGGKRGNNYNKRKGGKNGGGKHRQHPYNQDWNGSQGWNDDWNAQQDWNWNNGGKQGHGNNGGGKQSK